MEFLNESRLESKVESELRKFGIKSAFDTIEDNGNNNIIIDTSLLSNDDTFIKNLIKICNKLKHYNSKIINIPVDKWVQKSNTDISRANNPLGVIYRYIKQSPTDFKNNFSEFIFIFYNNHGESLPLVVNQYKGSEFPLFENFLRQISTSHIISITSRMDKQKSPVKFVIDPKEERKEELKEKKEKLVAAITRATSEAESEDEAWETLYQDEEIKEILNELDEEDDGKPKFDSARTNRMSKLNDEFLNKVVHGRTVKEIIESKPKETIQPIHLKISTINDEWEEVSYPNFQNAYDLDADIIKMINFFTTKTYPVSVLDIKVEDTSTNQDWLYTYTVNMEDGFGKKFTLTFDIPKFKNERFMRLGGNEKTLSAQLLLLPCIKVDENLVKCVTNYNTIRIERVGLDGKSIVIVDKLIKTLKKMNDSKDIKISYGDNSSICSKYELPVDYIDISTLINKIETKDSIYYFNQDILFSRFNAKKSEGIPYAVNKLNGEIKYYKDTGMPISQIIVDELCSSVTDFEKIYDNQKITGKMNYSMAYIMSSKIPVAVVIGYSLGMSGLLKLCGIQKKSEKTVNTRSENIGYIEFADGYLTYPITYENSMLFNGLNDCPTENYNLDDIDSRAMWLDFLDNYGGRIISDGLDNFAELFMDPITKEVCEHCKIPSTYFEMLLYANNLLADNKYNRHTDITGNRFRTNEIVAGYFYKAITRSYAEYKAQIKRGRRVGMTIKRSAVVDAIMLDPTSSDLSILNPLLEIESANSVSFKGLSGMNSDRSYGLDKRTYDDSMLNKLALSTGFSTNVGINRQTTIDMDIEGNRGYIKNTGEDEMSITKSFSMSEALTPFGVTRDDPFRSAMTFIQTSKHSMRTKKSMPLLITNGADEAMPFLTSDTFAYKAKSDGTVIEFVENKYMIIEYKTPIIGVDGKSYSREYVDLKNNIQKNSDGGFFITLKLDTDLKVGSNFKQGDIIAYDRTSFSDKFGEDDNLSYNLGVLAKVAILNTDEGFEDSTAVSTWLSDAMATDVVVEKDVELSKDTNIYDIVKVGQPVQEGDPLIIFQNAFDEKDANALLKSITDPEFISDLGRIRLKSKYTGIIQDIKIYRTCEIEDMSESLSKIVTSYEKSIKATKALYKKYDIPGANVLESDYKMQPTGKMKNVSNGVKIVFYISYNDKLSVGDKLVAQSANKGVIKNIFPEGLEPFTESHPNEKIHALFASRSFNARMVTSVWSSGLINKTMIELDRAVKEIMGVEWEKIEDM